MTLMGMKIKTNNGFIRRSHQDVEHARAVAGHQARLRLTYMKRKVIRSHSYLTEFFRQRPNPVTIAGGCVVILSRKRRHFMTIWNQYRGSFDNARDLISSVG